MGYSTDFAGELKFSVALNESEIAKVKTFLNADIRDHPEWGVTDYASYIDLELLKDNSGIKWNGSEKTYGMVDAVNVIIREMKKDRPDFGFTGKLQAHGEEVGDCWFLVIGEDGFAKKVDIVPSGEKIKCPHCEQEFYYESKTGVS